MPGTAESLPGIGLVGPGATLIGARVTSTRGFCAGVGSLYRGEYWRWGAEYVGSAGGGGAGGGAGSGGGGGAGRGALAAVGVAVLGACGALVGASVDCSAVDSGLRKASQPPHTSAAMIAATSAAAAGFLRYQGCDPVAAKSRAGGM